MDRSSPQVARRLPFPRDTAEHIDPKLQGLVDSVLAAGVLLALALAVYVLIFGNP